ncbi:GtrA family protein [uncultured Desulfovibrio sp.]|uniref:GtrA family protein n=1 Tax=uncultured Desulfovibrio sp. TaxID=167968 RepID=UPI00262DC910|nr:GtrA family protein [uncultured Desulfovibrio sp.]
MTGFVPTWEDLRRFVRSLLARRWIRFGLVGGAATLCYALLGLLFVNAWVMPMLLGNALAYLISFAVSYLGQSLWTFQAKGGHRAMLRRFAAAQAVGLGFNSCIVWLLVRFGLGYELAMPVAVVLVPVFVYLLCKYWVFRRTRNLSGSGNTSEGTKP